MWYRLIPLRMWRHMYFLQHLLMRRLMGLLGPCVVLWSFGSQLQLMLFVFDDHLITYQNIQDKEAQCKRSNLS
jgi:hypothetical protein